MKVETKSTGREQRSSIQKREDVGERTDSAKLCKKYW